MVDLTFSAQDECLYLKLGGEDFSEQVETCKYLHLKFDPKQKLWTASPARAQEILEEFHPYGVQISEYDKKQLNDWIDNLSDFSRLQKRGERRTFDVSKLLQPPRHEFQEKDVQKAINQTSLLFKWATGTGKSWALSAIYANLKERGLIRRVIILTSSIGVLNIPNELKKFLSHDVYDPSKTLVIPSVTKLKVDKKKGIDERIAVFDDQNVETIVCGYDTFKTLVEHYKKEKRGHKNPLEKWYGQGQTAGCVFLDECHLSGNPGSARCKTLLSCLKYWHYRYLFSATPSDKFDKFYPTLRILDKALVKGQSYSDWVASFCEIGTRWSRFAPNLDTWNIGKWVALQQKLSEVPYVVSRGKDLLNLPAAIDMPLTLLEMSKKHRALYEQFSTMTVELIKARSSGTAPTSSFGVVGNLVNTFQTMSLIVDNPCLLQRADSASMKSLEEANVHGLTEFKKALASFSYEKDFTKLEALDSVLDYECTELGNKVLVFYYHPATLEILKKRYPDAAILSTEMAEEDRIPYVEAFKKNEKQKVLIASIMIANSSFTLTECKAAIFYERCWSGIIYEQARGRIHRIGQEDEVRYYNFCYDRSIDNLQLEALKTKSECIEGIGSMTHLSADDWRTIFGGTAEQLNGFLARIR